MSTYTGYENSQKGDFGPSPASKKKKTKSTMKRKKSTKTVAGAESPIKQFIHEKEAELMGSFATEETNFKSPMKIKKQISDQARKGS